MILVPGTSRIKLPPAAFYLLPVAICWIGLGVISCTHNLAPLGHYQSSPVVADGNADDWNLPLRFTNADHTLQYNVTNDDNYLYVCVLSRDEPTILRMLRAGITLYFDPKGQNARDISLHYPLRKQPDPYVRASAENQNGEPMTAGADSLWKQELVGQSDSYGTTGMTGIENGQFGIADPKAPVLVGLRLQNHDSLLVYEAIVPLAALLGPASGTRSPKRSFSAGVVLNTASGQRVVSTPRYERGRGLGLKMNGMPMGGHRYGGGNGDNPPIREDASWYQFRLAGRR